MQRSGGGWGLGISQDSIGHLGWGLVSRVESERRGSSCPNLDPQLDLQRHMLGESMFSCGGNGRDWRMCVLFTT